MYLYLDKFLSDPTIAKICMHSGQRVPGCVTISIRYALLENYIKLLSATVNIDIFVYINCHRFMKMSNFVYTKISV